MIDDTFIFSVELKDYPSLFNRRIHIPNNYSLFEIVIAILASLRISDYEDFYVITDKRYEYYEINKEYNKESFVIHYGKNDWEFIVKLVGIDTTSNVTYLVSDGVGYGILGMNKERLYMMLEDSIDNSLDTYNPLVDDDFEFYDLSIDELNSNATESYNNAIEIYRNKVDKIEI